MKTFLLILIPSLCFSGQKYRFPYPRGIDDEFQNVYSSIPNKSTTPSVYFGSGAPTFTPQKMGDIYISTTTSKVYIATSTVTSASFAVMN